MFSSIIRSCCAAALLWTLSLADPIAFGNPAFAGITFGHPFTVSWHGGDGTPVSISLLSGNAAGLKPVTTLTSNYSGSSLSWTPVHSQSVRAGQLYALSIIQSGLTNYSPMFGISAATAVSDRVHAAYGAPVPVGTGRYYPIVDRELQNLAGVHHSEFGSGFIFPRHHVTGTPTGSEISHAFATGTGTGTPIGYATGISTGSRAAAAAPSPVPYVSDAPTLGFGWSWAVTFLSSGLVSLLLWA
ncbi:MAG: hypothetical protein Q9196_004386 [Gyalolechia fulgens]